MKQIFTLYTCDSHKSFDSMRLQVVTTSKKRLVKALEGFINRKDMTIGNKDLYEYLIKGYISPVLFVSEINKLLENGFLELWND